MLQLLWMQQRQYHFDVAKESEIEDEILVQLHSESCYFHRNHKLSL